MNIIFLKMDVIDNLDKNNFRFLAVATTIFKFFI